MTSTTLPAKRIVYHRLLMVIVLLLATSALFGQEGVLRFNRLSVDDGLSQSTIYCILQDSKGFMWFGTQDGLNRYDGYSFKIYRLNTEDPESLSSSYIYALHEDRHGNLWIGTSSGGLNRFDRKRESFSAYIHNSEDPESISHNMVTKIHEDRHGILWIATQGGGLNRFDPKTEKFTHYRHEEGNPNSLSDDKVCALYGNPNDRNDILWVGTEEGGLNRFDPRTGLFTRFLNDPNNPHGLTDNQIEVITGDRQGRLWIGTWGGLNRLDPDAIGENAASTRFVHYLNDPDRSDSLSSNLVFTAYEDREGAMWFGLANGGLNRLVPGQGDEPDGFIVYKNEPSDLHSLSMDSVASIYEDRTGALWVGTYTGGINHISLERHRPGSGQGRIFANFRHQSSEEGSLSHNVVRAFAEGKDGVLWIGTYGGGINRLAPTSGRTDRLRFDHFRHDPADQNSLGENLVQALHVDSSGLLWVGTLRGLDLLDPATLQSKPRFRHYRNNSADPTSISNDGVKAIFEDSRRLLWVGTDNGLNRMSLSRKGKFVRYTHEPGNRLSISHDVISVIIEDPQPQADNIWVGTRGGGLNRLSRQDGSARRYQYAFNDGNSLSQNHVHSLHFDKGGNLWVGTGAGLNRLDVDQIQLDTPPVFVHYFVKDGLPNNVINGIREDPSGYLWLSTNEGLSRFDPQKEGFTNYNVADGLQGNEFQPGAHFLGADGRLYFGGIDGFNAFLPGQIKSDPVAPKMVITEFRLFNRLLAAQRLQADSPLRYAIDETRKVVLNYHENMFSLRFAGLHYAAPERNHYRYHLEGIDKDWVASEADDRRATYANLGPGTYHFRALGSNKDGYWDEEGVSLEIVIRSPPWMSWWAYMLYALGILTAITLYQRSHRNKLIKERAINERLRLVDRLKDDFLANTSHELRTPLNGIIGLTESLIDGAAGPIQPRVAANLDMVVSSGKRLASLVDDILDFSKLKNKSLELHQKAIDLHALAELVFTLSRPLIGAKDLKLVNATTSDLPPVLADENRLLQIMHNLVGNAIKFTEQGSIQVTATAKRNMMEIHVIDTGIGIAESKHQNIFKSFEQGDGSTGRTYGGTGLGLAVSKQLIELHGGEIGVTSKLGEGSTFTFTLPLYHAKAVQASGEIETLPMERIAPISTHEVPSESEPWPQSSKAEGGQFRILAVDDDPVNRQVLVNHLKLQDYIIFEAGSGPEALHLVQNDDVFDLILLDVMMPRMTGYEVCRELRTIYSMHELPIIFLTANSQVDDLVTGFDVGGNDFLTKPVNKHELLSRVRTHLRLLDITRTLERKVQERTAELQEKHMDLVGAQKELVTAAHNAGMAEIASAVLHNVGNTINSVLISGQVISELLEAGRGLILFEKVANLLQEQEERGEEGTTGKRREVSAAINWIYRTLVSRRDRIQGENDRLLSHVQDILGVLHEQQEYTRGDLRVLERVELNELIEETLQMKVSLFEEKRVEIERHYGDLPNLQVEKPKLKRVIFYLLDNAREAIEEYRAAGEGKLVLSTSLVGSSIRVSLTDNGIGLDSSKQKLVFTQGYSTKQDYRGFGLHYCANVMKEMNGSIKIECKGEGNGAEVSVCIPCSQECKLQHRTPNSKRPQIASFRENG